MLKTTTKQLTALIPSGKTQYKEQKKSAKKVKNIEVKLEKISL